MKIEATSVQLYQRTRTTPAGFRELILAASIDSAIVMSLQILAGWWFSDSIFKYLDNEFPPEQLFSELFVVWIWSVPFAIVVLFLLPCLYYAISDSCPLQASPGKQLAGIKVVDRNGSRISFLRASSKMIFQSLVCLALFAFALEGKVTVTSFESFFWSLFNALMLLFSHDISKGQTLTVLMVYGFCYVPMFGPSRQSIFDKLSGRFVVKPLNEATGS